VKETSLLFKQPTTSFHFLSGLLKVSATLKAIFNACLLERK
jgi:hypothetical protein